MERWAEPPATRQCRRRGALVQLYSALAATQLPASALLLYNTYCMVQRYPVTPGIRNQPSRSRARQPEPARGAYSILKPQ